MRFKLPGVSSAEATAAVMLGVVGAQTLRFRVLSPKPQLGCSPQRLERFHFSRCLSSSSTKTQSLSPNPLQIGPKIV